MLILFLLTAVASNVLQLRNIEDLEKIGLSEVKIEDKLLSEDKPQIRLEISSFSYELHVFDPKLLSRKENKYFSSTNSFRHRFEFFENLSEHPFVKELKSLLLLREGQPSFPFLVKLKELLFPIPPDAIYTLIEGRYVDETLTISRMITISQGSSEGTLIDNYVLEGNKDCIEYFNQYNLKNDKKSVGFNGKFEFKFRSKCSNPLQLVFPLSEQVFIERQEFIKSLGNTLISHKLDSPIEQEISSEQCPQYYNTIQIKPETAVFPIHTRYQPASHSTLINSIRFSIPYEDYSSKKDNQFLLSLLRKYVTLKSNYPKTSLTVPVGNLNDSFYVVAVTTLLTLIGTCIVGNQLISTYSKLK